MQYEKWEDRKGRCRQIKGIYNKFDVHGQQIELLIMDEQVLIFSLAKWIEEHIEEIRKNGIN